MTWTSATYHLGGLSITGLEVLGIGVAFVALICLFLSSYRATLYWFVGGMCYWIGIELLSLALGGFGVKDSTAYLSSISFSLALTVLWLGVSEALHPQNQEALHAMEHTPLRGEVPTSRG